MRQKNKKKGRYKEENNSERCRRDGKGERQTDDKRKIKR